MLGLGLRVTAGLGGLTTALLLSRRHRGEQGTSLYPASCTLKARELEATSLHPGPCNQQSRVQGEYRRSGPARDSAMGPDLLDCDETQELSLSDSSDSRPSVSEADSEEEEEQGGVFDLVGASPNDQGRQQAQVEKLKAAVAKARDLCWVKMYESGTPGMVVAISVNGKQVWQHGFGYSDLENKQLVGTGCVMRIASISKPLTMAALARLWEEGRVDLDSSVSRYVPEWPEKVVDGSVVSLTVRQLCCHMAGVRHYDRKGEQAGEQEFLKKEYYIKEHFSSTDQSLELFKDDELLHAPGTKCCYTTHGFTLLAKVIENVTGQPFDKYMEGQFRDMGLANTYLDRAEPLIANRASYYTRDQYHRLRNAPYVDPSYKWAGGGYLSSVGDLIKFGSAMLYSFQQKTVQPKPKPPTTSAPPAPSSAPASSSLPVPSPASPPAPTKDQAPSVPVDQAPPLPVDQAPPLPVDQAHSVPVDQAPPLPVDEAPPGPPVPVEYHPGPFSSVNKTRPPVRYLPGFLKSSTVAEMWTPQEGAKVAWGGGEGLGYGLGWAVQKRNKVAGFARDDAFYVSHTGGAIGASSVLLVMPKLLKTEGALPQGVVVAILCNMQGVGLNQLAVDIAKCFDGLDVEKPVKVQKIYQC